MAPLWVFAAISLALSSASHGSELIANIAYVSNYVDAGVSNSNGKPALQAGLDYYHDSGIYAGTWASSVDFEDGGEADQEVDIYAGYYWQWRNIDWDLGVARYLYPGASGSLQYDTNEAYVSASMSHDFGTTEIGYSYSEDYYGAGNSHYLEGGISINLPQDYGLTFHVGHRSIKDNISYGLPDYSDWLVGLDRQFDDWQVQLALQGSDISEAECYGGLDWCDTEITLSVRYDLNL